MDPTVLSPITLLCLSLESDRARASLRVSLPSNGTWQHQEPAALEDCMHYHSNAIPRFQAALLCDSTEMYTV